MKRTLKGSPVHQHWYPFQQILRKGELCHLSWTAFYAAGVQCIFLLFVFYRRCSWIPDSHKALPTAYLNFSSWNNYCSLLSARAENWILPGKISFVSISFNIPSIHPIHSFIMPQCSGLEAKRVVKSSLVVNRWWAEGRRSLQEINTLLLNGLYFVAAVLCGCYVSWSTWVDFSRHTAADVQRLCRRWALDELPQ